MLVLMQNLRSCTRLGLRLRAHNRTVIRSGSYCRPGRSHSIFTIQYNLSNGKEVSIFLKRILGLVNAGGMTYPMHRSANLKVLKMRTMVLCRLRFTFVMTMPVYATGTLHRTILVVLIIVESVVSDDGSKALTTYGISRPL